MAHDPHAAHASADDEYLNPASGSGHEHTDANVSMILQFAIWLTASAVIVHILMWFTFAVFVNVRENKGPAEFPLAIEQGPRLPSGAPSLPCWLILGRSDRRPGMPLIPKPGCRLLAD